MLSGRCMTDSSYLSPGRHLAANELKTMLAYSVLTHDIKPEDGQERLKSVDVKTATIPNPKARVLLKRLTS